MKYAYSIPVMEVVLLTTEDVLTLSNDSVGDGIEFDYENDAI